MIMHERLSRGMIFNIQKFSVHDGPGIRTLVFFKGCPLSCRWCSNPESQTPKQQIMFVEPECRQCGRCTAACPTGALTFSPQFKVDYSQCDLCGRCVDVCYSNALNMSGKMMTVDQVMAELSKDHLHYRRSGGGITLSGGEALLQPGFARELLAACKAKGWHTAVETTGFTSETVLAMVLPLLDLVLLDIKHMDGQKHQEYIGQSNQLILTNARKIGQSGVAVIIRVPVIPGFNDTVQEIQEIASFAQSINGVKELHLLPYHRLGENKYGHLGYTYKMKGMEPPSTNKMQELRKAVAQTGVLCKIGG